MSLVYCCTHDSFFQAVQSWVDENSTQTPELEFLPAVLQNFMTESLYAPLFCVRNSRVFSFEMTSFAKPFKQWVIEEIERAPHQIDRIEVLSMLALQMIKDESWAIGKGLIVYDCLDAAQQQLIGVSK